MAKIILDALDTNFIVANNNSDVRGLAGAQTVSVNAGVTGLKVDSTIEDVDFSGAVADYNFQETGAGDLAVYSGTTLLTTIQGAAGKTLSFTDGTVAVAKAGLSDAMTIGATAITTTAAAVVPTTIDAADKSSVVTGSTGTVTGSTLTLTDGTAAQTLVGTSANDTYSATKDAIDAGDNLIDPSSTDNDTATISDDTNLAAFTVTNIENVTATISAVTTAATLDAANYSGITKLTVARDDVNISGSTISGGTQLTVNNIDAAKVANVSTLATGNKITVLTVNQNDATGKSAGITLDATGVTGNITVDGAATVTANDSTGTIDVDGFATTTSENSKATTITAAKATSIIAGATTNALTGVINVDAAMATDLQATVSGGGTLSVKGETGAAGTDGVRLTAVDDSGVTLNTSYVGTTTAVGALSIAGGAGAADVATVNAAGIQEIKLTNLETLNLMGNGAEVTYNVDDTSTAGGVSTFAASGTQTVNLAGEDVAFSGKTVTGINTLTIDALNGAATALDISKVSATKVVLGVNQANSAITVKDDMTVELTAATQTTGLDFDFATSTTTGNIKIISGDVNGSTNTAVGTATVNTFNAAATSDTVVGTVTLEAFESNFVASGTTLASKQTLVITGDENVTLGTVAKAKDVDASASTGKISLTTSANMSNVTTGTGADTLVLNDAGKHTVTAGAGIDTITVTQTAAESSVDGGAGNDTINVDETDVVYVVSGGAGDDNIVVSLGNTNDDMDAYIIGGDGTDTLTFDSVVAHNFTADGSTAADTDTDKFTMSSIEKIDITAINAALTLTDTQFANNKAFEITAAGGNDILAVVGSTTATAIDGSGVTVATGSAVTITYAGSTKADTLTGGVAAETFIQTLGGDSIDGGTTGLNTYQTAGALTETGSAASTGAVVNLSTASVNGTSVFAAIGDYLGDSVSEVAAGTVAYTYAAADSATVNNSAIVDTIANIDNVTGSGLDDYIIGNTNANVIVGGAGNDYIDAGVGADTITGGTGNDKFLFNSGDFTVAADSVAGLDSITDVTVNAATADLFDLDVTVANVNTAITTGSASAATFVANMNTLLNVAGGAGFNTAVNSDISAALVTLNAGDLTGKTYLAIDVDGDDAFTTADYAIEVTGITATSLTTDSFI